MARRSSTPDRWVDSRGRVIDEEDRGLVYDVQTLVSRRSALGLFGALGAGALLTGAVAGRTRRRRPGHHHRLRLGVGGLDLRIGRARRGAGRDGRALPGRRVQRRQRPRRPRNRPLRHPLDLRVGHRDHGRGRAAHHPADGPRRRDRGREEGLRVYIWHCDRSGGYSLYGQGLEDVNYLRGVQSADDTGTVEFTSIFPACYSGRWPHVHFEIYQDVANATSSGPIVKTSQIALPKETCDVVYAETGYEQSVSNLRQTSLTSDMVFGDDGGIHQLASMSGSVAKGYTAALTVGL